MSLVADPARGLVYFDTTSGEFPPIGFSFGIINVTTHMLTKTLPLNVNPGPMALDQRTGDVYVAGSTSIAVFDRDNQTFGRPIDVGRPILSMAHDSSVSQDIFVTSGAHVFSLDPQTGAILGNATFPSDVDGIVLDPANGRLYVGQYPNGEISVLEASNLAPIGTIGLPGCCALELALDQRTQFLYAATGTNYVYMIDAGTDTFAKSLEVTQSDQNSTNSIVVDNMTGRVFVASSPGGSIVELDGANGGVARILKVTSQVAGIAIDVKTQELYAANYHQVTVFDVSRSRVFLLLLVVGGAVVVVGVGLTYVLVRRRDMKERTHVQGRQQLEGGGSRTGGSDSWTL